MKVITIGGLPAAGKTYISKVIAENNNYIALEFESLRWDFFNNNLEENLYKYTNNTSLLKKENMREYYLRCALFENIVPLKSLVEWHKNTMIFISENICKIIDEAKLIRTKQDYIIFCRKYTKLINYMPEFEKLNKEYIICSHAFINTISFLENERIRLDFIVDKNILFKRFKQRENIVENKFDKKIEKYYKSYEEVLKDSVSSCLNTTDENIIEQINNLI